VILRVDPDSAVPVYEQLRVQITNMAATGTLRPGTQLPTIRQLASDLGLAKGTVSKAYDELLRSGVALSEGRRGTRIADQITQDMSAEDAKTQLQEAAEQFAVTARQLGVTDHVAQLALDRALQRLPKR
jgi:DNA-binding transcriptional regulator YhcF (GntR family)